MHVHFKQSIAQFLTYMQSRVCICSHLKYTLKYYLSTCLLYVHLFIHCLPLSSRLILLSVCMCVYVCVWGGGGGGGGGRSVSDAFLGTYHRFKAILCVPVVTSIILCAPKNAILIEYKYLALYNMCNCIPP